MRFRQLIIIICCAMIVLTLVGCQAEIEKSEDRLVGIFITTEFLNLHDQERIYANVVTKTEIIEETEKTSKWLEVTFEDIDGIAYFIFPVPPDDSYDYADSRSDTFNGALRVYLENGSLSINMEGNIYVTPTSFNTFFLHRVYQKIDGKVYLTRTFPGIGLSYPSYEGENFSYTMYDTYTVITFSINVMAMPKKIIVLQMDENHILLSQMEYIPGAVPDKFMPESNTSYLIVETHKQGGNMTRNLYNRSDEFFETFFVRRDGVCIKNATQIKW